ncbi:MAG: hypothetical protein H6713_10365 [Myxococcales bacterium]|nr:hypothetical protein [Myxococcales bacterium]MCB9750391.1 hypothetical protein [Myxococcales bacterium]
MSGNLTEQELREAAAEAGISPEELRRELVRQAGGVPATVPSGPGNTGMSVYKAEGNLAMPPEQAAESVRRSLERIAGAHGHRQGANKVAIVDEARGVTYQIQAERDGQGGALVRVDVDPSAAAGTLALGGFLVGGLSLAIFVFGWLFSLTAIAGAGIALGVLGGAALYFNNTKAKRGQLEAQQLVAQALLEAEDAPAPSGPMALPPVGRPELPSGSV